MTIASSGNLKIYIKPTLIISDLRYERNSYYSTAIINVTVVAHYKNNSHKNNFFWLRLPKRH